MYMDNFDIAIVSTHKVMLMMQPAVTTVHKQRHDQQDKDSNVWVDAVEA